MWVWLSWCWSPGVPQGAMITPILNLSHGWPAVTSVTTCLLWLWHSDLCYNRPPRAMRSAPAYINLSDPFVFQPRPYFAHISTQLLFKSFIYNLLIIFFTFTQFLGILNIPNVLDKLFPWNTNHYQINNLNGHCQMYESAVYDLNNTSECQMFIMLYHLQHKTPSQASGRSGKVEMRQLLDGGSLALKETRQTT